MLRGMGSAYSLTTSLQWVFFFLVVYLVVMFTAVVL